MRHEPLQTRPHPILSILGALGLLIGLGGAGAPADDFPASLDAPALTAWVKARTDLPVDRVALVGPIHVVAALKGAVGRGGLRRVVVEGEVVDRDWAIQHDLVSWRTDVDVDCQAQRVRSPTGKSYARRKRAGPATSVFASAEWTVPAEDDPIFEVLRAVCNPDFAWPLRPRAAAPAQVAARDVSPPAHPRSPTGVDGPIPTSPDVTTPTSPPPAKMATPATPQPPPPISRPEAAPATPIPALAAAPVRSTPTASGRGPYAVQLTASFSNAKARAELSAVARVLSVETRGLRPLVTPVRVNGKQLYRALLVGLDSSAQADALCRAATRLGYACMVRRM